MFLRKFCEHCLRTLLQRWISRSSDIKHFMDEEKFFYQSVRFLVSVCLFSFIAYSYGSPTNTYFAETKKTARGVFGTLSNIWNVLQKELRSFSRKLFSLNFPSYMFVRVLNTPLTLGLVVLPVVGYYRNYASTRHVSCL